MRAELAPKLVTPGPDAYQRIEIKERIKGEDSNMGNEACTFGMKTMKFFRPNKNPAPNAYFYDASSDGLAYSIGRAQRAGYQDPIYTDKYYEPKNMFPGPKISIGNERREYQVKKSKYPGPGTYNIPDTVGVIPAYLMNIQETYE